MKKGFVIDLERETLANENYRRVLYTTERSQLVLMSLAPGDEIGTEIHELDQFIRVESGIAEVSLDGVLHTLTDGYAVVIPAGVEHTVVNVGKDSVKLYSLYTPPEHKDGIVHATKSDEVEEHFDGITTE